MTNRVLTDVVATIRPALRASDSTDEERAQFLYDLVREVYDFAKFDVNDPTDDAPERVRIGQVLHAALPPTSAIPAERVAPVTPLRPALENSWLTTEPQLHSFRPDEEDPHTQDRNTIQPSS